MFFINLFLESLFLVTITTCLTKYKTMKKTDEKTGSQVNMSESMIDLLLNILETSKSKEDKTLAKKELRRLALGSLETHSMPLQATA
jgi:uncharacterized protein YycO